MTPPEPAAGPDAANARPGAAARAAGRGVDAMRERTVAAWTRAGGRADSCGQDGTRGEGDLVGSAGPAARSVGRSPATDRKPNDLGGGRFGWIFAAIWLFYLGEPLRSLVDHRAGWERDLGLTALGAFVVVYLLVVTQMRADRRRAVAECSPLYRRWVGLVVLVGLTGLMVPGAEQHALTGLVYVVAVAAMSLPIRQMITLVTVLFGATVTVTNTVPGWRDNGYGLAVLLAAVAASGVRLASERQRRLVEAQGELAELAVEHERTRIAGDLHDILGHSLTVVTVKAELAQRLLDVDPERARAELRDLERLCRDALSDVRTTAMGVRGISLPGELAAAREALAAADIDAALPTAADEVPSRWRELFAWTIREAVTNLVRHSGASHCEIRLTPDSVEILDNGVGSVAGCGGGASSSGDLSAVAEGTDVRGVGQGLAGLRRRAEAVGAQPSIGDRPGRSGFRVFVRVPA